jgi:hypothetical protein
MSTYRLTFAQLKQQAEHAISGAPDSRAPSGDVVNGALEWLWIAHTWSWRERTALLTVPAGAYRIVLPEDFGELVDLMPNPAATASYYPARATEHQVRSARAGTLGAGGGILWYPAMQETVALTDTPKHTLELSITAGASALTEIFACRYRMLAPQLTDDNHIPPVPYGFFNLLKLLVRAHAVSSTLQQEGHDWQLFNAQLPDFIAADTQASGVNRGQMVSLVDRCGLFGERTAGVEILMPGD